ncbi:MAG: radical SAM protein [Proteobacteria bacterium]|nr:radical SAM protein [Desulfocapsa sp.]MBU3946467.1 radical SAM protein [Pseudomonadota bacterium]MCG2744362.1 radical SAM protein [Desulfobacteraceae bacterium]MDO8947118.1 radical SAM protein [Desulfocapsaceae bacterium]MBU3982413.1 radical SAM protein [Pseudomonadota bacterium]
MKYLFGPVYSRRLGHSLGIDLLPPKICSLNCVYCEVGPTTDLTCDRKEYVPTEEILKEIDQVLARGAAERHIDVFTLTAMGEPTLHTGLGEIIAYLKKKTDKPVAVLTNGTLFFDPKVRAELSAADIVIPSLDAARQESFDRVNQPAAAVNLEQVIEGLALFSREFRGEVWLEILLVRDMNDSLADLVALQQAVRRIHPARIQLNTVARPPMDGRARPVTREVMEQAATMLADGYDGRVEILVDFQAIEKKEIGQGKQLQATLVEDIAALLQRRPCPIEEIDKALHVQDLEMTRACVQMLVVAGRIEKKVYNDKEFYQQITV